MMYKKFQVYNKFMFFNPDGELGEPFKFSTDLDKVGLEWDVVIPNGIFVDVISSPVEISSEKYGVISLVKIRADIAPDYHTIIKEFWVPSRCVIDVAS